MLLDVWKDELFQMIFILFASGLKQKKISSLGKRGSRIFSRGDN